MNPAEFHFLRPYWLLALLPALLLVAQLYRQLLSQADWTTVCDAELLPYILQDRHNQQRRWPLALIALTLLLTIIALAGPTWERLPTPVFRNDAALVIALDLSPSMNAGDLKPSRLSRARYKIADILNLRKDGQTALLVFSSDAFTVTPLTDDTETIAAQLNALHTDIMPVSGNNTAAALQQAAALLKQAGLQQGHILLIADDVDPGVSGKAKSILGNYRLSILGVGTEQGAPVKAPGGGFIKDAAGNIIVPKLNPAQLAELASAGGGQYRSISADDSDIRELTTDFERPSGQQPRQNSDQLLDQWDEKGPWLLLLIVPLAALSFRKGLLSALLILLLPYPQNSQAVDWQSLWKTRDQLGQEAYLRQDYALSAKQFDKPEWKAAAQYKAGQYQQAADTLEGIDNATAHYNRGNALAKAGQLQAALDAYDRSLQLDPDLEDVRYNKALVEKALQQQNSSQQNNPSQQDNQNPQENQSGENPEHEDGSQSDPQPSKDGKQQSEPTDQADSSAAGQDEADAESAQQSSNPEDKLEPDETSEPDASQLKSSNDMENEQASEQWLKRIPDDPSGLLKRKFRYQYGQRNRNP